MAVPYQRTARLVPWYHRNKPQCIHETLHGEQCTFSAIYEEIGNGGFTVCKTHRDITLADPDHMGKRFRLIAAGTVYLR